MSLAFYESNFQILLILFLVSASVNVWARDFIFSEKGEIKNEKSFEYQNSKMDQ